MILGTGFRAVNPVGKGTIFSALELFTEIQKNKQLQNRSGKFNGNDSVSSCELNKNFVK